jgi:hypothetical protein
VTRQAIERLLAALLLSALATIAGCGGGGDDGAPPVAGPAPETPVPAPPAPPAPPPPAAQNSAPIVVDAGPPGVRVVNLPYTSVTICAPNTSACQTIDHILVDTGSSGLRIMASVLNAGLSLPQVADTSGRAIVQCMQFADGYSWGPVKQADVRIAGMAANAIPIQIIGDPNFGAVPTACANTGPAENSVQSFGANGLIGVGHFLQDCGPVCAQIAHAGVYYICSGGACQSAAVPLAQQVVNPVGLFATDNNGVVITLPAIPAGGAPNVAGTMLFGIGTQANNGLGNARVVTLEPNTAQFTTVLGGRSLPNSFLDSGSNGLFFPSTLPTCASGSGFYCPPSTQEFAALIQGRNGVSIPVNFSVANAVALFSSGAGNLSAFPNLGGPSPFPDSFDWGLPFFFGRTVYTAIENRNTPAGTGPFVAF